MDFVTDERQGAGPSQLIDISNTGGVVVPDADNLVFATSDFTVTDAGGGDATVVIAATVTTAHTWTANQTFNGRIIASTGQTVGDPGIEFGVTTLGFGATSTVGIDVTSDSGVWWRFDRSQALYALLLGSASALAWNSAAITYGTAATYDVLLKRGGPAILSLENEDAAQQLRVYGAVTGSKYVALRHDGTNAFLNAQSGSLFFDIAGVSKLGMDGNGSFLPQTDGVPNLGSATQRWSIGYISTAVTIGTNPATIGGVRTYYNGGGLYARNNANSTDMLLVDSTVVNAVHDIVRVGVGNSNGVELKRRSGSAAPTTSDLPADSWTLWKNTTDATVKLYYNDAGSLKSVALA